MNGDPLSFARDVLAAQPFNDLMSARLTAFNDGTATLELDIDDRHLQQYGLVHGGVLGYLADNALTFAAGTVLGPSVITAGLTVDYLQGARAGTLRATGTVVHHNARHAVCTVTVECQTHEGTTALCATATGRVFSTRQESASPEPATSAESAAESRSEEAGAAPAYVLVRTADLEVGPKIAEYVRSVDESLDKYGAEILVQDLPARVLEGAWSGFVTLLRFRDRAAAERWYDSPEYRAVRHLRQESSAPTAILVDGVRPGHRAAVVADLFGLDPA